MKPQYIITGGPGTGKTSVIDHLTEIGYRCVPEVAREIIREQMKCGGEALPWGDTNAYTKLMLERSVDSFKRYVHEDKVIFFDRGIPDTLAYAELIGFPDQANIRDACMQYRYNPKVFLFPAWQDIYETDEERKQTWEEAVETYKVMKRVYVDVGYDVLEVPCQPVENRIAFILDHLQ